MTALARDLKIDFALELAEAPTRVARDESIYQRGERRTHLYVIEAGTVAIYASRSGANSVVEFAYAGDTVGYGLHENHNFSAQAVGETRLRCLPVGALDRLLQHDRRALQRYAEALQREFECRRDEVLSGERKLESRVAALLVALSRRNQEEGRDPRMIDDDGETAARYLDLGLQALGQALVQLERAGLIERCVDGVRIVDLVGLEEV